MGGSTGQQLATVVAIIAASGLALAPFCKSSVDALDATGMVPDGWAGVFAILLGAVVGAIVGVLAALMGGAWYWVLLAGIAGAFSGTGAIVHNQAAIGAQTEKAVTPVVPVTKATSAAEPVTTPAPVVTPAAKPATTASSVVFTPAADPKASSSAALDV